MENLTIIISVLAVAGASCYMLYLNSKNEKYRYREFVKSVLAESSEEYEQGLDDEDTVLPVEEEEEFVELSEVPEENLIKQLNKTYAK